MSKRKNQNNNINQETIQEKKVDNNTITEKPNSDNNIPEINYYNLKQDQKENILGNSEVKKEVYKYFELSWMKKFELNQEEKELLNEILFVIYSNTSFDYEYDQRNTLKVCDINGINIVKECTNNFKIEKNTLIKLLTYLFITHRIFISDNIISGGILRNKLISSPLFLPDISDCAKFLDGLDDIFNNLNTRAIYLSSNEDIMGIIGKIRAM